jgi:NitT/TauT family transport system substrate-binding protein
MMRRSVLLTGAGALFALPPRIARAQDAPAVRLAMNETDVTAVVNYADAQGYFKNAGLDVSIIIVANGPAVIAAVLGGSADVGASNIGSLSVARSRGLPIKVFAPAGLADKAATGDLIVTGVDSPIRSGADLNGKVIGIAGLKTLQQAIAMGWIDRHGGDARSVKFVEIPFSDMGPALDSKRVDAALIDEPFTTMLRPAVRSLGNQFDGMALPFPIYGFFATEPYLQSHAATVTRLAGAIRQAALWGNTHHAESAAVVSRYTKIDVGIVQKMARMTYGTKTQIDPAEIKPLIDGMAKYGIMTQSIDPAELIWTPAR